MILKRNGYNLVEVKAEGDTGKFTGYASVFGNVDSYRDIIAPGAFQKSISERKGEPIPLLWQHDPDDVIGVLYAQEDAKGLRVEGELNLAVQCAIEAHALVKQGAIKGMSIGYMTKEYQYNEDENIRTLTEVELMEVSLVTFPANTRAQVDSVKSLDDLTERDFEEYIRGLGLSISQAKTVTAKGFKALGLRDAGEGKTAKPETEATLRDAAAILVKAQFQLIAGKGLPQ